MAWNFYVSFKITIMIRSRTRKKNSEKRERRRYNSAQRKSNNPESNSAYEYYYGNKQLDENYPRGYDDTDYSYYHFPESREEFYNKDFGRESFNVPQYYNNDVMADTLNPRGVPKNIKRNNNESAMGGKFSHYGKSDERQSLKRNRDEDENYYVEGAGYANENTLRDHGVAQNRNKRNQQKDSRYIPVNEHRGLMRFRDSMDEDIYFNVSNQMKYKDEDYDDARVREHPQFMGGGGYGFSRYGDYSNGRWEMFEEEGTGSREANRSYGRAGKHVKRKRT
jgi:hypothetical protein